MQSLSITGARRLALAAQGFGRRRGPAEPGLRALLGAVRRLGAVQIDSVNAVVRSHYLPLYARLGPYQRELLDAASHRRGGLFEYWGHEASLLPVELQPLFRWRMEQARNGEGVWRGIARFARERRAYIDEVRAELRDRPRLRVSDLSRPGLSRGPWWGWSDGKRALEWLFWTGEVTATRGRNFERHYELTERALPPGVVSAPTPAAQDAQRALVERAATALGVATPRDLADYYRMAAPVAGERARELAEAGTLEAVAVEGWREMAYVPAGTASPRGPDGATALLTPFDSLTWDRARTERLFGFRYRLELYTPAAQRVYGYYVLPFLHRGRLVGRVDVRADRKRSVLVVPGAFGEEGTDIGATADALVAELRRLAGWLGLATVEIGERGDLARAARALVGD